MSSSLVMTTLLVGMSWPWVAALAMGEADMSLVEVNQAFIA